MPVRPEDASSAALVRMLAILLPPTDARLYAVSGGSMRLVARSGGSEGDASDGIWREIDPRIAPALATGGGVGLRLPATADGAVYGTLRPVLGADGGVIGLLLLCDRRPRRIGRRLAATLDDAAEIAAGLLRPRGNVPLAAPLRCCAPLPLGGARLRTSVDDCAAADGAALARDLATATGRGEMRLAYQGYVDLETGRMCGAEALLRWRHPVRGELPPAAFIPLAEATGAILPLGAWAMRAALAAAAGWPARFGLAVNVSALQFHQPGFVAEVEAALRDSGVAPDRLELEITETVLMRDGAETTAQLQALIARGVRIALDDFGTGYSALAYLARLPHHRIKLDRAFVQDLGNPATLALVQAIIRLARGAGVGVTAEGVERADQLEAVRALGVTHAQGFALGAPVADPMRAPALA